MFANPNDAPTFRSDERAATRGSSAATVFRLVSLVAIAAVLLVATIALRFWTAANDAKLPPYEYAKKYRRPIASTAQPEVRDHFTFPLPPRL